MSRLSGALKVRFGEGRMVALLVGVMAFTSAGGSIGGNGIEALFYARFGVQFLPYMYVALGLPWFYPVKALLINVVAPFVPGNSGAISTGTGYPGCAGSP